MGMGSTLADPLDRLFAAEQARVGAQPGMGQPAPQPQPQPSQQPVQPAPMPEQPSGNPALDRLFAAEQVRVGSAQPPATQFYQDGPSMAMGQPSSERSFAPFDHTTAQERANGPMGSWRSVPPEQMDAGPLGEFGRGVKAGFIDVMPEAVVGEEAKMRSGLQRPPAGIAGMAGQTVGSLPGVLNPARPDLTSMVVAGGAVNAPVKALGAALAGKIPQRAAMAVARAVEGGALEASPAVVAESLANVEEWETDPLGKFLKVLKAGAVAGTVGAVLGGAGGAVEGVARGTATEAIGSAEPARQMPPESATSSQPAPDAITTPVARPEPAPTPKPTEAVEVTQTPPTGTGELATPPVDAGQGPSRTSPEDSVRAAIAKATGAQKRKLEDKLVRMMLRGEADPATPSENPVFAVKMKDGSVVSDPAARVHADLIESQGINPDDIADAGWTANGRYYSADRGPDLPDAIPKVAPATPNVAGINPDSSRIESPRQHSEQSAHNAVLWLDPKSSTNVRPDLWLASDPSMATGQGANKGVRLEFEGLKSTPRTGKPSSEFAAAQGLTESVADATPEQVRAGLRSITVDPKAVAGDPMAKRLKVVTNRLKREGWTETVNPDGTTTYRKGAREEAQVVPEAAPEAQGPVRDAAEAGEVASKPVPKKRPKKPAKAPTDEGGSDLEGLGGEPVPVNDDGTITLYHRTKPKPEGAKAIRETGRFVSQKEDRVFASTAPTGQAEGFGSEVIEIRVKPSQVRLEDAFDGGEVHVSLPVKKAEAAYRKSPPPPKAAEKAVPSPPADLPDPDARLTSARKAMTTEDRATMGLDELNSPERRGWEADLADAKEQGIPDRALRIAAEVNEKPRALSSTETAGVVVKMGELKNEHAKVMERVTRATDPADVASAAAEASRIEGEFDVLTRAVRASGTEKGRALASQKLTLDQDLSLVAVKARAKAAKGSELTAEQAAKFEALTKELEETNKKVAELERAMADQAAERAVRRHKAGRAKMDPKAALAEFDGLLAKAKGLLKAGCKD